MLPWNNWFHCIGSTYGTWMHGDPRGWRSRHHKEHVEGDYRNPPPPGKYDRLYRHSRESMRRGEILLDWPQRVAACRGMAATLTHHNVELIDLSVGAAHFHLVARFTPLGLTARPDVRIPGLPEDRAVGAYEMLKRTARHYVGLAKKNSARLLSDAGLAAPGGIWAVRSEIRPIRDRRHQRNVVQYIRDHANEGAAVWSAVGE